MRGIKPKQIVLGGVVLGLIIAFIYTLNLRLEVSVVNVVADLKPVVVIDAGHGGVDGGATGNGIVEKEINLSIAQKTAEFCRLFGFEVIMTREGDYSIHDNDKNTIRSQKNSDLKNRLEIMIENPNAIVLSIHLNKFTESYVNGAQVFYAPNSAGSDVLAEMIQNNFQKILQPENDRKIKRADSSLFILYNNKATPAVLVECGFLSNPQEAEQLKLEDYQDKIAMTLCYSLLEFYNRGEMESAPEV